MKILCVLALGLCFLIPDSIEAAPRGRGRNIQKQSKVKVFQKRNGTLVIRRK